MKPESALLEEDHFSKPLLDVKQPVSGETQDARAFLSSEPEPGRSSTTTPTSSELYSTPEYDLGPPLSDGQQVRVAIAQLYEEAVKNFLEHSSLDTLETLAKALAKISCEDLDLDSASRVLSHVSTFLDSGDIKSALLACQLMVRYYLKQGESSRSYPLASLETCTTRFRQISGSEHLDAGALPLVAETVNLWSDLAEIGEIEEHQAYHLVASSLKWIFGPHKGDTGASAVRYSYMNLLVATYKCLPRNGRYKVVHDLLSMMLRISDCVGDAVHVLLRLIAVTGGISSSTWSEAISLRKRPLIEADAQVRHKDAVALCQMISRRLIEEALTDKGRGEPRQEPLVLRFSEECASALMIPQAPSAEVLLSAFITTLFNLSTVHRNRKYSLLSFTVLRVLQNSLVHFRGSEVVDSVDPVSLVYAMNTPEQANYLASRQCTIPGQPYFDLELAVTRSRMPQQPGQVTQAEWMAYMKQWPISEYYGLICDQIIDLANRGDIPDSVQVELLRVLESIIADEPQRFNSRWLDRLSYASAKVCEALVPVTAAAFRGQDPKPYELLHKLGRRLTVPGVKSFKKRAIAFFSSISVVDNEAYEIAWLYLLISVADPDINISLAASDKAGNMLFAALRDDGLDARLSNALLAARFKAGENAYLVQDGIRSLVHHISATAQGARIRRLVSTLLADGDLELAALLVEADGTFMPLAKIKPLFERVVRGEAKQVPSLRMLSAALNARPRLIVSQATAAAMFGALLAKLKLATEVEISYAGPILRELVALGGVEVQQERARKLETLLDNSFAKLCEFSEVPSQAERLVVLRQLIFLSGCVRFWGGREHTAKAQQIVEKLAALGRKAEKGSSLSQLVVRTIFGIASKYRVLFNNAIVDAYLSSLEQASPEFDCLMQLLFQYDWHASVSDSCDNDGGRDTIRTVMMRTSHKEDELATSSMLQKYLVHVLQLADQNQSEVALRIISKALDHYLVVVDRCLPIVVSLCFSAKLNVAQAALSTYAKVCSRWPSSVLTKVVPGLRRCSEESDVRPGPFTRVWLLAKESQNQRNIKPLLEAIVASLRHDAPNIYAKLVITGLMQTPLDPKDAATLKLGLMENVFSFSPRNKAHSASHIVKMILIHVFETWLTARYGLGKTRMAPESAKENEALEYIDVNAILRRFADDRGLAKRAFEELLDEQYAFGSREMQELIYGADEEVCKKRRIDL